MRPLLWVVATESTALLALACWWLLGSNAGPPFDPELAPATLTPALAVHGVAVDATATALAATASAATALRRHDAAPASWQTGDLGIIVQGLFTGVEPPPKADQIGLTFQREGELRRAVVTGNSYAVSGLTPGAWRLRFCATGCARLDCEHTVTAASLQRFDLALTKVYVLPVFLRLPDGKPLQPELDKAQIWGWMLQVVATTAPLGGDLPATASDQGGDLGVSSYNHGPGHGHGADPPDGELLLECPPPANAALLFRHLLLAQQPIAPGQAELRFTLAIDELRRRMSTVTLRVLDGANGQPCAEASVWLDAAADNSGKADAEGRLTFTNVQPGLCRMQVAAKDHEDLATMVQVPASGTIDLGDLTLQLKKQLTGRVVDADGKPAAAMLSCLDLDGRRAATEPVENQVGNTDADGEFTVGSAGPRRYVLFARARDGRVGNVVVDARSATVPPILIQVASPVKIALAASGGVLTAGAITIRDSAGVPVATWRFDAFTRETTRSVPPGDYQLEVHDGSNRLRSQRPLAARGASMRVEVR